jgi:hypothetical protein
MDLGGYIFMYGRDVLYVCLYERDLLYIIFIRTFIVENFNVSSTDYNAHAKLPRYV